MLSGQLSVFFLRRDVICNGFPSYIVGNFIIGISLLSRVSVHLRVVGFPAAALLMSTVKIIFMGKLVPILLRVSYLHCV